DRQRPHRQYGCQRQRSVEMREQIAVAGGLGLQGSAGPPPADPPEPEIALTLEVQLGRPSRLRSGGEMDEAIVQVYAGAGEHAAVFGGSPQIGSNDLRSEERRVGGEG